MSPPTQREVKLVDERLRDALFTIATFRFKCDHDDVRTRSIRTSDPFQSHFIWLNDEKDRHLFEADDRGQMMRTGNEVAV